MKLSTGEKVFQVFLILFVIILCITMIYPFLHVLSISFSTFCGSTTAGNSFLSQRSFLLCLEAILLTTDTVWQTMGNTVFRTVVGTVLTLVFLSLGAYPLSRKYLPHRGFYTMFIVVTMFLAAGLSLPIC